HDAMVKQGLEADFPPQALAQAQAINQPATAGATTRDLRSLPWCSIDNDDSMDLDQLSVGQELPGGATKILVAVADVDALVKKGTPLDDHAKANTTSVYTAGGIFPMLPEKLSTDLTSLAAGKERLAIVVEMTVDAAGIVGASDVYPALVVNRAKLAYDSVAAWLDGSGPAPAPLAAVPGMDAQIRMQDRVAQAMRKERQSHGALRLETTEVHAVFDGNALQDLLPDRKNRAKELIEDFMIAANGIVARFLDARKLPSLRRVLRTPKHWDRIVSLAAEAGEKLPATPDAAALDAFLTKRHAADPDRFPDLSLSVIKLLGSGEYDVEVPGETPQGHFGLAVKDYTHSTAPNRRFPDVITQRLVKAAIAGAPSPYPIDELRALAAHCTQEEDNAAKVERQVAKSAAALLLSSRIGAQFDGIVTGASDKGTWARITQPAAEGRIVRGFERLQVGDRVRVQLVHTDVDRGFIDFETVK
ncbi:MAG TPA: RNB domain-containing ribonuclease, partial [Usitatibacter sp.]|nr:RNB domain-containing ribonuclease [Usitatibacter sp.]